MSACAPEYFDVFTVLWIYINEVLAPFLVCVKRCWLFYLYIIPRSQVSSAFVSCHQQKRSYIPVC